MSMLYIGIDNGLTGGIVAISDHPGPIVSSIIMPTRGKNKGNEVDAAWVANWLANWDVTRITVILETPGKFSAGTQALCSMWDSYGAIRGVLESRGIRHHRIPPQKWQKELGCLTKGDKNVSKAKAQQLFPGVKITNKTGDSVCIAEYAKRLWHQRNAIPAQPRQS